MGCDIHAHVEVKLNNAWHHLGQVAFRRNYRLFAYMADVRNNGDIEPLNYAKGLPEDMSLVTAIDYRHWERDAHSQSWLNYDEMLAVAKFAKENRISLGNWHDRDDTNLSFGMWLFGNYITEWKTYPEDYPPELQDVRLVFWFDN